MKYVTTEMQRFYKI